MDPNAPQGFPMQAGYPVPVSQSPPGQQFPYYPNPIPSYPPQKPPTPSHPQQQHPFGAMPMQPGGHMMPTGFPQQPSAAPHPNFPTQFAHSAVPTTMAQFLPPQATSSAAYPPNTAAAAPQNMASMPANNMGPGQPQKPASSATASPAPPQPSAQAPSTAARDKARVATLLDINSMLLQEVLNLQSAGKAGVPQPAQQGSQEGHPSPAADQAGDVAKGQGQKPSQEYIDCMRRLQYNLAYLATFADRSKKTGSAPPSAPAIMSPPPHLTSMNEIYQRLAELFPRAAPGASGASQPSPQAGQGNGRPSPSPATDPAA
ncbi:hypothetical protein BDW42DRAFT_34054 [Aspergillus taichungensis]|uniref:Glutamine repeat protein-1 n=1 Tax=Aspergillus taichungensis TaxID=482145 RepID=A0A2J5HFD8_9EURO|nr:hypothetical protein BDW42DRAFT_34054 [Aspergillus taichungensis]